MADILMPKATAVWLVDNTSLTFEQIADFCGLHPLEVRGIADGDVARDIRGADPLVNGQLTREELDKAQNDDAYRMQAVVSRHAELLKVHKAPPKYTPVSRRQDRPDAIMWFVRNHPEVTDAQIAKMLGTTKSTIESVRNRTHWNSPNIKPVDPVTLGLVGQQDAPGGEARGEGHLEGIALGLGDDGTEDGQSDPGVVGLGRKDDGGAPAVLRPARSRRERDEDEVAALRNVEDRFHRISVSHAGWMLSSVTLSSRAARSQDFSRSERTTRALSSSVISTGALSSQRSSSANDLGMRTARLLPHF